MQEVAVSRVCNKEKELKWYFRTVVLKTKKEPINLWPVTYQQLELRAT